MAFIDEIAAYVIKYAPQYGIKVYSPIIAQSILESASGTSELAKNAHNYFGLKYRANRCPSASGTYIKVGSEQSANGKYTSSTMTWFKFKNMESGVKGYFEFISISNYSNLKGITDPKKYLKTIKSDGYCTSLNYVSNVMNVIKNIISQNMINNQILLNHLEVIKWLLTYTEVTIQKGKWHVVP